MAKSSIDARLRTVVRQAIRHAEQAAGDDDRAFLRALREHAVGQAQAAAGGARSLGGGGARSLGGGAGGGLSLGIGHPKPPKGARLDQDPRYLAGVRALARRTASNARIIGGTKVAGAEFDDCVAIGDEFDWGCTGTLIASNVVLTAGHCKDIDALIFIGNDVNKKGRTFKVAHRERHKKWAEASGQRIRHDLMLLFLDQKVSKVTPRKIASSKQIDAAADGRVVGFGTTNIAGTKGYGVKRQTDVPIVSPACKGKVKGKADGTVYGCYSGLELVAGKPLLQHDTCKGDSGGPLYVAGPRGKWLLAGVTSRGTDLATNMCGDGGLYVRVDQYLDWIRATIEKYG